MKTFFYIANWKMNQQVSSARSFAKELIKDKECLLKKIILCPSFSHLYLLEQKLKNSPFLLGAQTCSAYASGPYTGQVSALMLAELGCSFCIIGHSERRQLCSETDQDIAHQYEQLTKTTIIPIICIGEKESDYTNQLTYQIIEKQLQPLCKAIKENPIETIFFAYEPVWAIGTDKTPTIEELTTIFAWLKKYLTAHISTNTNVYLIYGGSVDEKNCAQLKKLPLLDGLLIGNASLDFKKFKNIVV